MAEAPDEQAGNDRRPSAVARWLSPVGGRTAASLAEGLTTAETDAYGRGGVVAELEEEVATVLGTEAALLLPTGTMAQGIALRLHAEDAACPVVAMHPTAHPLLHEGQALERVHGLQPRPLGDPERLPTVADLDAVAEPLAAVLVELPARELGGRLPAWDDLLSLVQGARDRGAAVHCDGARLWECEPAYGRDAAEIAGLFDTTYVSLYKGLGGIGGACLAGEAPVVARAAEWRHRLGGQVYGLWPYAAAGLRGLREHRPAMADRLAHLRAVADELRDLPDVEVVPDPPEAGLCHLYLRTSTADYHAAAGALAEQDGVRAWEQPSATVRPGWLKVELHASANLQAFTTTEVRDVVARLTGR